MIVFTILFLIFMEGLLSFDNAIVLAMIARKLPEKDRKKALTYGIIGAFSFRFVSLFFLTTLIESEWVKIVGGLYLLYLVGKHFFTKTNSNPESTIFTYSFIKAIVTIELMDIVFSIDSILASVAVSSSFFVVLIGGLLGIVMMRFASTIFIKLIDKNPGLENTAYHLISIIGTKLVLEGFGISFNPIVFWTSIVFVILLGFKVIRIRITA